MDARQRYREARRQYRIALRMHQELLADQISFGCSFQGINECGIFNIPPQEVFKCPPNSIDTKSFYTPAITTLSRATTPARHRPR